MCYFAIPLFRHSLRALPLPILVVGCLFWLSGCHTQLDAPALAKSTEPSLSTSGAAEPIDVGIIFAEESNYLCIPLSRLGIEDGQRVTEVTSSCDCTRPSIVAYQATRDKTARGLRIDFIDEDAPAEVEPLVMPLAVVINLRLDTGRLISATLEFLYTKRNSSESG